MRHARSIGAFLVLGLGANLLVCWVFAASGGFENASAREQYQAIGGDHQWLVNRWDHAMGTRVLSMVWRGDHRKGYNEGSGVTLLPTWGTIMPPHADTPTVGNQLIEGWGFPMRSWAVAVDITPRSVGEPFVERRWMWTPGSLVLPLRPIWTGVAINSLLGGLLLMGAWAIIHDLFRRYTARNGS